jgi:fumarate hydratase class II
MSMLSKLFPETLFPRKLTADAEQRLRLAQARAEEALVRTHVENALMFVDTLAPEVGYERALDIYVREMSVPDPLAAVVATRALVSLGEALVPKPVPPKEIGTAEAVPMPELRLDEAAARRRRA